MPAHIVHALVVAGRFGLLLGLALWMGLAAATLALSPVLFAKLERAQAHDIAASLFRRVDRLLIVALGLLAVAMAVRLLLDPAPPAPSLLLPLAAMAGSRLISALAVGPAQRALVGRLRDANSPASDAERTAFGRLHNAWMLLLTFEACVGLYGLYAVS